MSVMGEAEEGACAVYDVFINHRGPDTKKNLASPIYGGLIKYGLRVFLDQEELKPGDSLSGKIRSSISSSSVHVAIFSKRYAESFWCLNELLEMLESRSQGRCKIIPIFYGVKPTDLRYIDKGCYAYAFRDHETKGRHDVELVTRWKDALQKASNISGIEFKTEECDHILTEEILEKVLKEAKWEILYVADYPVGLHQAVEDFNIFLKEKQLSGTTVIGIIGPDGSGKSTLVKQLYNCYFQSLKFKRYCFLSELNNENDLAVLQQKLVRDLLGNDKYSISDTTKGKRMLQTCLKGCGPVLIVLDGLDKKEQIESLLVVKKDVLAEGSLILVTCHDESLLREHKLNEIYPVELLQGKDRRDLFCWNAFDSPKAPRHLEGPPTPPEHLEDLVEKFVEICCGFPLALEVLGRKLHVKQDQKCWEEQLKELSRPKFPQEIVDKILKVTYNDLEEEKKEVFLDVAHFLVGEDTDLAVRVLGGLHRTSALLCLQEFQRKCLLDLEKTEHFKRPFAKGAGIQWRTKGSSKIRMHNLVRKMATQIASEDSCSSSETKPLRLVEQVGNKSIFEQSDNKSILQQAPLGVCHYVRGIRCEYRESPSPLLGGSTPSPMCTIDHEIDGLRLLVLNNFPLAPNRLSGDLIWLRQHKSKWGNNIPHSLSLRNLRVLELHGVDFERLLDRMYGNEFPWNLGELTVGYCGESPEIPNSNLPSSSRDDKNSMEASSSASGSVWDWFFRELKDLGKLVLKKFKGLKSLPFGFKELRNLRHLDLSGWSDLEKMPESFTGLLQLECLALQDCMSLSISDLGGITKLEYLDFEGCSLLRKLPDKTTAQGGLRYLNLKDTSIEELPQDLGNLNKLELLLIKSSYLRTLPDSFHELGQLRILTLSGDPRLNDISSSISIKHFLYLEIVELGYGGWTLPQGIAYSSVKVLHWKAPLVGNFYFERDQVQMLLDRSQGEGSNDDGTKNVGATDHNRASPLTELELVGTHISALSIPPDESLFPDLEIIVLSQLPKLWIVQSLPCNLRRLYLNYCPQLLNLPLGNLGSLRILDISSCLNLTFLNLKGLRSIEEIVIKDCSKLRSIEGLAQLHTLSYLNFSTWVSNSTIWSDILEYPFGVSTVILGGANVPGMYTEKMDSVKQSIMKEFQGAKIEEISIIGNKQRVRPRNMESYGGILLCFIAKKDFFEFVVSVGDNVYSFCRSFSSNADRTMALRRHEEAQLYRYRLSRHSDEPKRSGKSVLDCTMELEEAQLYTLWFGKSVLDCTIEGMHSDAPLEKSITKAWIVMIRNRTGGRKICKQLFSSLCCIPI